MSVNNDDEDGYWAGYSDVLEGITERPDEPMRTFYWHAGYHRGREAAKAAQTPS